MFKFLTYIIIWASFATPSFAENNEVVVCHAKTQHFVQFTLEAEKTLGFKAPRNGTEAFIAFRLPLKQISIQNTHDGCRTQKFTADFVKNKIKHGSSQGITLTLNVVVDGEPFKMNAQISSRNDPLATQIKKNTSSLVQYCGKVAKQKNIKNGLLFLPLNGRCGKSNTTFFGYPASQLERENLKVGRIRCKKGGVFKTGSCSINLLYFNWPLKFFFPSKLLPKWRQVRLSAIAALDKKRVLVITSTICEGKLCKTLGM